MRRRPRGSNNGFEEWGGYMQAKKLKLKEQYQDLKQKECSSIFSGVTVYVNGYTDPSSAELKRLLKENGGRFEHYYSKTGVSHVVATNLTHSKVRLLKPGQKVVTPNWITESVSAGRLLPDTNYLLVLNLGRGQRQITISKSNDKSGSEEVSKPVLTRLRSSLGRKGSRITETGDVLATKHSATAGLERKAAADLDAGETSAVNDNDESTFQLESFEDINFDEEMEPESAAEPDKSGCNESTDSDELPSAQANDSAGKIKTANDSAGKIKTANDTGFISDFYRRSRLHHISQWGNELKAYVRELQNKEAKFTGREELKKLADSQVTSTKTESGQRLVVHVDMDCFFVSVGLKLRPHLRGKPVAVTHARGTSTPQSGLADEAQKLIEKWKEKVGKDKEYDEAKISSMAEIASCSYEAREAGVKNGMFLGQARMLCPDVQTIPYDFEEYQKASRSLYDIVASYTHDIEAVSCDELFIDCTRLLQDTGASWRLFVDQLRLRIYQTTGCTASTGIGCNMLLARLATRRAKPDGVYHVISSDVTEFMSHQPVTALPGVGYSLKRTLSSRGVETCSQLKALDPETLRGLVGPRTALKLSEFSRGIDHRSIQVEKERKSVSAEVNYGIRFTQISEFETFLKELSIEVSNRMKRISVKGKQVTLKLKVRSADAPVETSKFLGHGVCDNVTRSHLLPALTDDPEVISHACSAVFTPLKVDAADLRGIGIQMSRLEETRVEKVNSILNFAQPISCLPAPAIATQTVKKTPKHTLLDSFVVSTSKNTEAESRPVPPLPSLDLTIEAQPSTSAWSTPTPGSSKPPQSSTGDFLVSPSQIDEATLNELPPSIQAQIRSEMTGISDRHLPDPNIHHSSPNRCKQSPITALPSTIDEATLNELPPSIQAQIRSEMTRISDRHLPDPNIHHSSPNRCKHSPITALPSTPDNSVLEALPADIRHELQTAYAQAEADKQAARTLAFEEKQMSKNSPKSKRSPQFKVPRGRGAKRGRKPKSVVNLESRLSEKPIVTDPKPTLDVEVIKPKDTTTPVDHCITMLSWEEIRSIMIDWLHSTCEPTKYDEQQVLEFVTSLASQSKIDYLYLMVKLLRRRSATMSVSWREACLRVESYCRSVAITRYGADFKL